MTALIQLSRGLSAIVDEPDYDWLVALGRWYAVPGRNTSYARRANTAMHMIILDHRWVDHINGDGLDNRRSNLRPVTNSQNIANSQLRSDNRSGFKGVHSHRCRWMARCRGEYIGTFSTPEEAARAYDVAALLHFGEFARLNFSPEAAS